MRRRNAERTGKAAAAAGTRMFGEADLAQAKAEVATAVGVAGLRALCRESTVSAWQNLRVEVSLSRVRRQAARRVMHVML